MNKKLELLKGVKAISSRLLVIREESEMETASGIVLLQNELKHTGIIVHIGNKAKEEDPDLNIGDRILFQPFSGIKVHLKGFSEQELISMRPSDVMLIIPNDMDINVSEKV